MTTTTPTLPTPQSPSSLTLPAPALPVNGPDSTLKTSQEGRTLIDLTRETAVDLVTRFGKATGYVAKWGLAIGFMYVHPTLSSTVFFASCAFPEELRKVVKTVEDTLKNGRWYHYAFLGLMAFENLKDLTYLSLSTYAALKLAEHLTDFSSKDNLQKIDSGSLAREGEEEKVENEGFVASGSRLLENIIIRPTVKLGVRTTLMAGDTFRSISASVINVKDEAVREVAHELTEFSPDSEKLKGKGEEESTEFIETQGPEKLEDPEEYEAKVDEMTTSTIKEIAECIHIIFLGIPLVALFHINRVPMTIVLFVSACYPEKARKCVDNITAVWEKNSYGWRSVMVVHCAATTQITPPLIALYAIGRMASDLGQRRLDYYEEQKLQNPQTI